MTTTITIVSHETGETVHTIETEFTGRMLDKMLGGLYLKTDLDRYDIVETTEETS